MSKTAFEGVRGERSGVWQRERSLSWVTTDRCKASRGWDFGFNDSVGALRHAFKAILYFRFSGGVLAATLDPVRAKLETKGTWGVF